MPQKRVMNGAHAHDRVGGRMKSMKRARLCIKVAACCILLHLVAYSAIAQTVLSSALTYNFTPVTNATTTGQLGSYIIADGLRAPRPGNYVVDWTVSGTAFATCTFNAQGSSDGVNWYYVDNSSPVACTASGNEFVVTKPVLFLRINVVAITGGDGTSKIVFHYVGGRS
jgi:hypothetical protein